MLNKFFVGEFGVEYGFYIYSCYFNFMVLSLGCKMVVLEDIEVVYCIVSGMFVIVVVMF